jgi:hypothetical protein
MGIKKCLDGGIPLTDQCTVVEHGRGLRERCVINRHRGTTEARQLLKGLGKSRLSEFVAKEFKGIGYAKAKLCW